MKIENCGGVTPQKLSYSDVLKQEGIYRMSGGKGHVVVLKVGTDMTAFFVTGYGDAEPCMGVKDCHFEKASTAKLCLEIRE